MWTWPQTLPLIQHQSIPLITSLLVAFTPATSPLRGPTAALLFALACSVQFNAQTYLAGTRISGPIAATCWISVLNAVDLLVLSRFSFCSETATTTITTTSSASSISSITTDSNGSNGVISANGTTKEKTTPKHPSNTTSTSTSTSSNALKKYLSALSLTFNFRRIATPHQIHCLPRPATTSKTHFLLTSTLKLLVAVCLVQLSTLETSDEYLTRAVAKLPLEPKTILFPFLGGHPGARNLWLRVLFTVSFGVVCRASVVAGYTLPAVLGVGLEVYGVEMWPDVDGGLVEGWSVGRFWGLAWHQTLRQVLTTNADFLASVLRISPSWRRYFRLVFAFTVSGVVHLLMDVGFGVSIEKSGALLFFVLQVLGIVLETVVVVVSAPVRDRMPLWMRRGVGYAWVAAFMVWTAPVWINPILVQLYSDGVRMMSPFLGFGGWDI
ncbi:hypothetical protein BO71DRAFT_53019 [Aspergillus ellipticus CBS 707.79]|uniref:Wax synthase domain-containing protein n=1 Tax=Aspergillus ellipticus CBS 707.79 TaxID=1448320 RepID=A0A319D2M4_9EURO|nr:hypothetical protein BO71DRAFT_53019 [Aspergillus ellipticus CBS 707.79]